MPDRLFRKKNISDSIKESEGFNGGLKRTLSATNLVTLGIGAIVGTGIFVITGQAAAEYAGPSLTISFLISAVCCVLAGLCYAEFASMIPISGSVYSYSYVTTGELLAWFIGWDLVLEYLFACSSVAVGWSGYMLNLLEGFGIHIPQNIAASTFVYDADGWAFRGSIINFPAVFIVGVVTAFLIGGIRQSAFVNNIIVAIKVSVILLFIGFGISYIDVGNWEPYIPENVSGEFGEYGWSGILRGAAVVFFAYLGFDALSTTAQETRNPQKDMPRGILISLVICAILYISVTAVLTGIVNYKDLHVDAPVAIAVDRAGAGLSWLGPFIKLGAIAGISSVILVMMLGQSRIYYAISNDGLLPKIFSKVNRRGVPYNATIFASIITGLTAGLFPLDVLSELVSIGTLMAFTIVCILIIVLRKTQPNLRRPFKTPFVPWIPLLGAGVCLLQMFSLPASTWLRLAGWTVVGLIIYFLYGIRNSNLNKRKNK
ncbi:MAG: amino acid permease [Prevotellaceae bacterium]|jgi:APA family basic amino acid/polyamine antiporter|nr:amino acid permease [Prevotellaceae bacterium]